MLNMIKKLKYKQRIKKKKTKKINSIQLRKKKTKLKLRTHRVSVKAYWTQKKNKMEGRTDKNLA